MKNFSKMRQGLSCMVMALLLMLIPADIFAQNSISVSGIVMDDTNEPVIGAAVMVKGTTTGVITDIDGRYTISAPANGILSFSYVGLKDKEEKVNGRTTINIIMETDSKMIDEVVVIGYGTQRRGSVTGAVSAVKGQDMIKTKNENPQNMLTGRIPGLRVWQKSSEPGTFNNSFDVRGMGAPLIIIDGIPRSTEEFQRLNAMDIDDISVLKDAAASAVYGVRGANGVILINTKRGQVGKPRVTVKAEFAATQPVKLPEYLGAADYMQVLDDILMDTGQQPKYTDRIAKTRAGYDPDLYPDVNWMDAIANDYASNQRVTVDISGGTETLRYSFVAAAYNERGILKRDKSYDWDPTIKLQRYNVRSNVDLKLSPTTQLRFNIGGYLQDRNSTTKDISQIFQKAFVAVPHAFPAQYSSGQIPTTEEPNVWAWATQSGYKRRSDSKIETLFSVEQDLKFLLPGLKVKGTFSFDRFSSGTVSRGKTPDYYVPATGRDDEGNLIIASKSNGTNFLDYSKSGDYGNKSVYMEATLSYDRTFAEKHSVAAMLLFNRRNYDDGSKIGRAHV